MKTVAEILREKSNHSVVTVSPDSSVFDAIKTMAERGIGAVVVVEGETVLGMLSERDYARKVVLQDRSSRSTKVRDIMTDSVYYVGPADTREHCMAMMTERHFRHLPVIDKQKLIGLLSIGDLVKDVMSEQKFIIHELERYISGGHA
ncbi:MULTISPECIES: CBS domain-containing protein [Achromobacter]|uniref:CBS domain-containing protein n=1 Tax=Achromobacter spanius TaxID=217203 RepID=A0ABY8GZ71_9BURK|nr:MULTISPECIES: CBS domain-containing protein [Achromobacter]WAI86016.1 CBS domain-containing protein [Achromobacter spanius]WEX96097.1 CBS domain-containing protein [Achromobacter sp. SS2-2022]WFP10184.1 CBS domain-containing protein [Achromobacter spanius]